MAIEFYYFDQFTAPSTGISDTIETYTVSANGDVTIQTDAAFSLSGSVQVGDIVKLYDSTDNTNFIYGVLTGKSAVSTPEGEIIGWALGISYDYRIYTDSISDMTNFLIYADAINSEISKKLNVSEAYKISTNIETAAYSEQYIRYKVTTKHDLIIDARRRNLLEDFFDIVSASNIFIVDTCGSPNGVAYKLFIESDTFDAFNNKFRKDVKFRIIA